MKTFFKFLLVWIILMTISYLLMSLFQGTINGALWKESTKGGFGLIVILSFVMSIGITINTDE